VAEPAAAGDVGIHVAKNNRARRFARPGEEAHTTGVMDLGSHIGTLAAQPLAKPFDFWKRPTPPGGGMVMILSPGGKLEDLRHTDWHLPELFPNDLGRQRCLPRIGRCLLFLTQEEVICGVGVASQIP
jgi:hypothetical protein